MIFKQSAILNNIFKLNVAMLGLILSASTFAASTITSSETIVVLAINEQAVKSSLLQNKKDFKVDPGQVSLSVRYQEYFDHRNGQHDILKSGVVNLQAPQLQDNQRYQLRLVNPPKDFDAAQKYVEQPTIALYDQNNQLVVQQTGANGVAKSGLLRGLFSKSNDFTQAKSNTQHQPQAVYGQAVANAQVQSFDEPRVIGSNTVNNAKGSDQQLIQIWKKASKSERQKFMSWLADQ